MSISPYPIAISMRASNMYDYGHVTTDRAVPEKKSTWDHIVDLGKDQLGFDMWLLTLGIVLTVFVNGRRVETDPDFSFFSIMFEAFSAYGNNGLSMGYTGTSTSLSAQFGTAGQLTICALMIRGRHRGLPYDLDRAVNIPGMELLDLMGQERQEEVDMV